MKQYEQVYRQTWEYAEENSQEELYRASLKANITCKDAIEAAIPRYYHVDGYTLDTKNCAKELINVFGLERVAYVLANTLLYKRYDGRISPENLHWARTLSVVYEPLTAGHGTVNARYVVGSCNTGLTDLLATRIRKLHMVHSSTKQNNEMEKTIGDTTFISFSIHRNLKKNGMTTSPLISVIPPFPMLLTSPLSKTESGYWNGFDVG